MTNTLISAANFSLLMHLAPPPIDRSTISSPTRWPSFCTTAANRSMKFLRSPLSRVDTRPASMNDKYHRLSDPSAVSSSSKDEDREEDEDVDKLSG